MATRIKRCWRQTVYVICTVYVIGCKVRTHSWTSLFLSPIVNVPLNDISLKWQTINLHFPSINTIFHGTNPPFCPLLRDQQTNVSSKLKHIAYVSAPSLRGNTHSVRRSWKNVTPRRWWWSWRWCRHLLDSLRDRGAGSCFHCCPPKG